MKKPTQTDIDKLVLSKEFQKAIKEGQEAVRIEEEKLRKAAIVPWWMYYIPMDI